MQVFDPTRRIKEVHEMHETLCKIRAGKLNVDEIEANLYNLQGFDGLDDFDDDHE